MFSWKSKDTIIHGFKRSRLKLRITSSDKRYCSRICAQQETNEAPRLLLCLTCDRAGVDHTQNHWGSGGIATAYRKALLQEERCQRLRLDMIQTTAKRLDANGKHEENLPTEHVPQHPLPAPASISQISIQLERSVVGL